MTVLWDTDPESADRYAVALGEHLVVAESAPAVQRLLDAEPHLLVVAGPHVPLEAACQLASALRLTRPALGVVLTRSRVDVGVLQQAVTAGVRAVVAADDLPSVADACRKSRELSDQLAGIASGTGPAAMGRVVTVFSAKGGVGKTTFSTNIGVHLATMGYRTLVLDLDLGFGDVAISLQLVPRQTLEDVVGMAGSLDDAALAQVVTTHPTGLDVLCAPLTPGGADRVPGEVVSEVLRVARRSYDFVIVDTPPAFTDHVLASFDSSDAAVLIATLDIPAIKNLRLTLDTLDLLGMPRERRTVVLNRSDSKVGLRTSDVAATIKQDIAVMVPGSVDVPASVNKGVPILLEDPRHPVSVALRTLTERYVLAPFRTDARPGPRPSEPAPERGHGRRLLSWGSRG